MKLALGIFHFNPHWNVDVRSAHRHISESFGPLLYAIYAHPQWQVTIEMSGSGLEFVSKSYPSLLDLLRSLIAADQVELISALYTPNLWIAFPSRDLFKSVELNRKCLADLGLPWSGLFFSQEAFFGAGVAALKEHFDVAICKDDYLAYYYHLDFSNPCFELDGLKIVIASNHLLNTLNQWIAHQQRVVRDYHLSERYVRHLQGTTELNTPHNFPASEGNIDGYQWFWYHCGDGNHFGTTYKPDDLERCYRDPAWIEFCIGYLESLELNGFRLGTIRQFVAALDYSSSQSLPPLVEGSWNPGKAQGVLCWMGRNSTPWENDAAILASIQRSRIRVIHAERALEQSAERAADEKMKADLDTAWRALLHAQISDTLGWRAGPQAVRYGFQEADRAFILANQILGRLNVAPKYEYNVSISHIEPDGSTAITSWPVPEIFGAEGSGAYSDIKTNVTIYDCDFRALQEACGVRFPFEIEALVFCPSGLEDTPCRIPIEILKPDIITLPLANGLLQLSQTVFLVKDTAQVHVAATLNFKSGYVEFAIHGSPLHKGYTWRFYLLAVSLREAIRFANTVNAV